jgi:hypothetical protein
MVAQFGIVRSRTQAMELLVIIINVLFELDMNIVSFFSSGSQTQQFIKTFQLHSVGSNSRMIFLIPFYLQAVQIL